MASVGDNIRSGGAKGLPRSLVQLIKNIDTEITVAAGFYALLRDEKSNTTNGGTFTAGAWRTRDLNTKSVDEIGITLSSNQFTLPAGTYRIDAHAPAKDVGGHKSRLRNITDGVTTIVGRPGFVLQTTLADTASQLAEIRGQFTISSAKIFEIQHFGELTKTSTGFGFSGPQADSDVEVYTEVELIKVA